MDNQGPVNSQTGFEAAVLVLPRASPMLNSIDQCQPVLTYAENRRLSLTGADLIPRFIQYLSAWVSAGQDWPGDIIFFMS